MIVKGETVIKARVHASPRGTGRTFHFFLHRNASPVLPHLFFFKQNRIIDFKKNSFKKTLSVKLILKTHIVEQNFSISKWYLIWGADITHRLRISNFLCMRVIFICVFNEENNWHNLHISISIDTLQIRTNPTY